MVLGLKVALGLKNDDVAGSISIMSMSAGSSCSFSEVVLATPIHQRCKCEGEKLNTPTV